MCSSILEVDEELKNVDYLDFSLEKDKILDFKMRLNEIANTMINIQDLTPSIDIDAQIELSSLNKDIVLELEKIAPFGPGNPKPVFCSFFFITVPFAIA